ncbi:hypothetical protein Hanom_Chr10g00884541 [Helianthus anomalus]
MLLFSVPPTLKVLTYIHTIFNTESLKLENLNGSSTAQIPIYSIRHTRSISKVTSYINSIFPSERVSRQ